MWAFAIFDRVNKTLFCSRDHFGIKPFYYASGKGFFVFGSEIKQIKHYLEETSGINEGILADFLFWGHETHSRETFFRKIYALPPASYLFLDTEKIIADSIEPKLYWQPDIESEIDDDQAIDRFRDLFFDSVNLRLRSDVPVGTTLSGGLDSSSVACAMFDLLNGGNGKTIPKMFTSVYPDPGYSEKIYADAVVKKTGFGHICVHPSSEGLQKEWSKIIWHMDEPFGNLSYYSNWKVYEMCRSEHVPVILNGQV
jgi:asparagine synthase (glutamine-hydrolysing)